MATKAQTTPLSQAYPDAFFNGDGDIVIPGYVGDALQVFCYAPGDDILEVGGVQNPYGVDISGKADEDGRFSDISIFDPAAPQSAIRGLINWRYTSVTTPTYQLEAGKSIRLMDGCRLTYAPGVQEGDIFGVFIDPDDATNRIALTANGAGIDEQPAKRQTKGTALVYRYKMYPSYTDAGGTVIPAQGGLETIQQTSANAVNNRGAFATGTYYLVGDLVAYMGALYLRKEEGGDMSAFDPTKWDGGGGAVGAARDPYAVGDNLVLTAAVTDPSNTWANGDLTAYGSPALQDAGAPPAVAGQHASILVGGADVATKDEFDQLASGGVGGWRYVYGRRNDGTSGWTRTPKG